MRNNSLNSRIDQKVGEIEAKRKDDRFAISVLCESVIFGENQNDQEIGRLKSHLILRESVFVHDARVDEILKGEFDSDSFFFPFVSRITKKFQNFEFVVFSQSERVLHFL